MLRPRRGGVAVVFLSIFAFMASSRELALELVDVGEHDSASKRALGDEYVLGQYDFETGAQGWTSEDLSIDGQAGTFWQVEATAALGPVGALNGSQSMWCGTVACEWVGYGNDWDQRLESIAFSVTGDCTLSYTLYCDVEAGFDFLYVEFENALGEWTQLRSFTGTFATASYVDVAPAAQLGPQTRLRFRFVSDGSYSDEDQLDPSVSGAVILDDVVVLDGSGVLSQNDFELEPTGSTTSTDGFWNATIPAPVPGIGDFAALHAGASVLQEDPRGPNLSQFWGFFDDPLNTNLACDGHPEQGAVPYGTPSGPWMENWINSPWLTLDQDELGNPIPALANELFATFDVYMDLPPDALIAHAFRVRSMVGGCATAWRSSPNVFLGDWKVWQPYRVDLSALVDPAATAIQFSLGCIDLCPTYCGIVGSGNCHTQWPLFDNVAVIRRDPGGPVWGAVDRFADAGIDSLAARADNVGGGDVLVVRVSSPQFGIAEDAPGEPAVYAHIATNTALSGADMEAGFGNWPYLDSSLFAGGKTWHTYRLFEDSPGVYTFELRDFSINDGLVDFEHGAFWPWGAVVEYFFSARDNSGRTNYYSYDIPGVTDDVESAANSAMEFTVLPTQKPILFVQQSFDDATRDFYRQLFADVGGSSLDYTAQVQFFDALGHGLFDVEVGEQSLAPYDVILYAGDVPENDIAVLHSFLQRPNATPMGLYVGADDAPTSLSVPAAQTLRDDFIDFSLVSDDHQSQGIAFEPSVEVVACFVSSWDEWGSCGQLFQLENRLVSPFGFDVVDANSTAVRHLDFSGTGLGAQVGEVTSPTTPDERKVLVGGFGLDQLGPAGGLAYLTEVLRWLPSPDVPVLTQQVIQTVPSGLGVSVDGAPEAPSPLEFAWAPEEYDPFNAFHTLRVTASFSNNGVQYEFIEWREDPSGILLDTDPVMSYTASVSRSGATARFLAFTLSPTVLDFGSVPVGQDSLQTFVLRNEGPLTLSGEIASSCAHFGFESGDGPFSLAEAESLVVTVRYAPQLVDSHACAITTGLSVDVAVTGEGLCGDLRFYVDSAATGAATGLDWLDAFTDLQAGIDAAAAVPCPDATEVWVAAGTYLPGSQRSDSFTLASGVELYGGFTGSESSLEERDWLLHPTVLSGEIAAPDSSDNSYHVVIASFADSTGVLDGFVVTRGFANGGGPDRMGAGILIENDGAPMLRNLVVFENTADTVGGGMSASGNGAARLENVAFFGNGADSGGGLYVGEGGHLAGVLFSGNTARDGAGAFVEPSGGASSPSLINVTFANNGATRNGGALYCVDCESEITNAILWSDQAASGGAEVYLAGTSAPIFTNSLLAGSGGSASWDPALGVDGGGNIDQDPLYVDPAGSDLLVGTPDDDLRLSTGSPAIDAGTFSVPVFLDLDLSGNPRLVGPKLDMGAYEYGSDLVSTPEQAGAAKSLFLYAAVPNPFNPRTTLSFDLPRSMPVTLEIYNVAGRLVRTLIAGQTLTASRHDVVWTGRDDSGASVSSGVYLYRLRAPGFEQTRRMVLVR